MSNPNIEAMYGLSPAQEGMLFHSVLEAAAGFYVTQLVCEVRRADVDTLVRAWQEVVNRHAIFRTAFAWKGVQKPLQVVGRKVTLPVVREDWRERAAEAREAELAAWLEEDRRRGFDLSRAPAMRLALLGIGEAEWILVWSHHHVLLDGWSLPRVLREVREIYAGLWRGETMDVVTAGLTAPRLYQDYVTWLGRQELGAAEAFWREMLADAPRGRALGRTDWTDQADRTDLMGRGEVSAEMSEAETAALQAVARSERLTLNTVVQGVWACVLAAETGADDVVYGITVSGRPGELPGVEEMIGLFINTLPMRVRIQPGMTLGRWLAELQARLTELRKFEHTPLVKVNGWAGRATGDPLFETLFVFENYPVGELPTAADAEFEIVAPRVVEKTNYPLTIAVAPGARLAIKLAFDSTRYDVAAMERMVARLVRGLRALPGGIKRPLGELEILAEEEKAAVRRWGRGEAVVGEALAVGEAIAVQAARTPERVAVSMGGERVTYAELMAKADAVAARLVAAGVNADEPVGILLERSVELVAVLLGVWQAGAAYAPLEAEAPAGRVRAVVVANRIRVVVGSEGLREKLMGLEGVTTVEVGGDGAVEAPSSKVQAPGKQQGSREARGAGSESDVSGLVSVGAGLGPQRRGGGAAAPSGLAYVLFTSGSTGRPKGVAVSQGALANHMKWFTAAFGFSAQDVVLQKTPVTFDASVWEFWAPLMVGGRLELAAAGAEREPAQLLKTVREAGVTVLQAVPTLLAVLAGEPELRACETLRVVFSGGEALTAAVRDAWGAALRRPLVNLYGPTEATIECATWTCGEADGAGATVPIGCPAPGCVLHVLDAALWPVAPGVAGELCVAGAQVARGYWGRPELTAERFVPDPFSSEPGARMYRTGDIVRWRADGVLEYLRREDGQVKVRGQRVELGEVEAALAGLPGVRQAVAVVRAGELIGYVQTEEMAGGEEEAKALLASRVPSQLVPSRIVRVSEWPRSSSGKIDRRALPAPEVAAGEEVNFVAARTEDERAVAAIWKSVLGVARVGATDDFFALGGHSLTAMQVMARVRRELKVELPVRALFDAPTVEAFARAVAAKREPEMEETTL